MFRIHFAENKLHSLRARIAHALNSGRTLAAVCAVVLCGASAAWGTDYYWIGGTSGNWNDSANWETGSSGSGINSTSSYPSSSSDTATISDATNYPVISAATLIIDTLTINSTSATLELSGAYNLTVTTIVNEGTIIYSS